MELYANIFLILISLSSTIHAQKMLTLLPSMLITRHSGNSICVNCSTINIFIFTKEELCLDLEANRNFLLMIYA